MSVYNIQCCVSFCGGTAVCIRVSPPSEPLSHPPLTLLGHHRAPSWAPRAYSSFPRAICFTRGSVCIDIHVLPIRPALPFPPGWLEIYRKVERTQGPCAAHTQVPLIRIQCLRKPLFTPDLPPRFEIAVLTDKGGSFQQNAGCPFWVWWEFKEPGSCRAGKLPGPTPRPPGSPFSPCSLYLLLPLGFLGWLSGKESASQCRRPWFDPWVGKIPWRRKWQPTVVFLPGKSHKQESGGRQPMGSQRPGHNWATKQQPR